MSWPALLALAVGTYGIRLAGILLRDRLRLPERATRLLDLGATALLIALVATAALTEDGGFAGWARPAGVVAGAAAALLKAPFVLVVVLAAGVAAGLRALGIP
ncbi:AzlD domain-containing protein [Pseudonocardia oroxyli]|uniref:Branched-chain amino acid transport protein (AzlD) n=1 Tax=Pseudonocardia oroxyli TaxID=366584 RepID=A0A1G7IIT5_PSEOR|nr:AzlD domain-containing protein [Pseudonocardia oroxyli]SDF12627.1 Branched-chain amino acid transport protein (AzlD) [Pseudonocardia oroxyli]